MMTALSFPQSSIPYRLQLAAQNEQSRVESQSATISQIDQGGDKVTLSNQISQLNNAQNVEQKELTQKHNIATQRLDNEYARAQSRIEQEYARKKNSLNLNFYV